MTYTEPAIDIPPDEAAEVAQHQWTQAVELAAPISTTAHFANAVVLNMPMAWETGRCAFGKCFLRVSTSIHVLFCEP